MNARIKELAKQARIKDHWSIDEGRYLTNYLDEGKFAELIIKECEKVAKDPRWYSESPSDGWRNPIRYVCKSFKEHFGVEE